MNKAEMSRILEEKVQEKLKEGYSIPTYALDAASRDRVKRGLHPQGHPIPHDDQSAAEWQEYIRQVEEGTYEPNRHGNHRETQILSPSVSTTATTASGSVGLWKARRH
jgi:hypothetical protein